MSRGTPRPADLPPIAPGDVVADKYVVEEVLGSGAMGFVVAAKHKLIGQRVAIKLIKSAHIDDADALARFKREAQALVAVQSENVVRVLDYGALADGSPYLVMELLQGRDLFAELRARGPLPLGEAAEIVLQACEGLAAVHACGIIHRDVKPANLFLTMRANGKPLVKIVDFGISKATAATEEELSLTRGSLGSPHYMSPEQLRSARGVDARSDVWSLGVTLHRALTGDLPFAGESVGSLMSAVMTDDPRPLRELRPELPAEVEEIVKRCLAKNAEDRYASVQELADALTPFAMPSPRTRSSDSLPPSLDEPELAGRPHSSGKMAVAPTGYESTARAHVSTVPPTPGTSGGDRPRKLTLALAIAMPLALAGAALALLPRAVAPSTHPVAAAPADGESERSSARSTPGAGAPAIVITDVPRPKTTSPEAAAAYQAALQAVRDASLMTAADGFTRAAALDPTMAAAELRSAIYGVWLPGAETRKHARAAMSLRSSLSERDRALLTALEPMYVPPQPDTAEAERRLDALVAARPNDAELLFVSAMILHRRKGTAAMDAMRDRMLALDPGFAAASWIAALTDDPDASSHAVDRCLAISPSAASCLRVRATAEETAGDCAALETDAQRMVAIEGASRRAYEFLSVALFARGRPLDAVREALRLKWKASTEAARPTVQASDEAKLAIATGDFAGALTKAAALDALAERTESEPARREAVRLEIDLYDELGERFEAARVADGYLRRMGAWPESDVIDDDPRPRFYAAAVRGGLRSPGERDAARRDWVTKWTRLADPFDRPRIWLEGFAGPAETPEEAAQALAALPSYEPLPNLVLGGGWTAPETAKVYALADRAEALPELKLATGSCRMLQDPLDVVRARFWLGEALEKTGDIVGACAAYRKVVELWGREKRSVTAAAAAARATALRCSDR